jgi:hypothetical protein
MGQGDPSVASSGLAPLPRAMDSPKQGRHRGLRLQPGLPLLELLGQRCCLVDSIHGFSGLFGIAYDVEFGYSTLELLMQVI